MPRRRAHRVLPELVVAHGHGDRHPALRPARSHRGLIDGRLDLTVDPDPTVGPGVLGKFLKGEHLDRLSGSNLERTAKCSVASHLGGLLCGHAG